MGTHLSALTSCASRRSNSINRNRRPNFRKEYPDGNPSWATRSTTSTTTTRSTSSLLSRHYQSDASVDAIGHCMDINVKSSQQQQQQHRSIEYDEKCNASASLERDLSGEGFQEEVDSILDSINFTLTDSLRTLYGPTTDVITTTEFETEIMTTETMTTMKKRRTVIQNSQESKLRRLSGGSCFGGVKTRSEKLWDSSCDDVIKDIFHQIYAQKIVVSTPTHPSHVAH